MRRRFEATFRALLLSLAICMVAARSAAGQERRDEVRGRVTSDSGAAIAGATVIITVAPTTESFTASTDSSGAYSIALLNATGEYLVYVTAVGKRPFRQRLTRAGGDTTFVVNVRLAPVVQQIAPVVVQARRQRPQRSLGGTTGPAGTDGMDKTVDGVVGALPPDLQGNIDAMAALIPGLTVTANGTSAFGLGPDANMTTLNGLAFSGSDLPRDLATSVRFSTSPWDPTFGGFSGALASVSVRPGSNLVDHHGHITFDAPALQFSDPVAASLGQRFTNVAVNEGGTGPIVLEKYFYNYGITLDRRMTPVTSLLDLNADALARAGISADSAAALVALLGAQHVPLTLSGIPSERLNTSASFIGRFDRAPRPVPPGATPAPVLGVVVQARYSESEAPTLAPTASPANTGKSTVDGAGVQGTYSRYFGLEGQYLNETVTGVSFSDTRGTPYLELPSGTVLIASELPDGTFGFGSAQFGGNSAIASDARNWSWEAINQSVLLAGGKQTFPIKLTLQSRLDGFSQSPGANRLGTFNYLSLADLENNSPSSYSRTLNAPAVSGGQWLGGSVASGNWTTGAFVFTGGARVDANVFTAAPAENPAVDSTFGARTDHAPNSVAVSPRFGFNWYYTALRGFNSITGGQGYTIYRGGPTLRGGIGEFRNYLPSSLLAGATGATGLPGGARQLLCVGPDAPVPDWQTYAADPSQIPSTCAGGTATFADTAPAVTLIDRAYAPSRSWRASLGWTSGVNLPVYLTADATYSLNLDQPGTVDLNFAGTPAFTLANEANRPVFVGESSIVPSTGGVSSVDSRVSTAFGRVIDRVSDLRGDAKQLTLYAIPHLPFSVGLLTVAYTYQQVRSQARGFDAATAGDPRLVDWSRAPYNPTHVLRLQAARALASWMALTTYVTAMSGTPYTPLVAANINGDGLANDAAFVFNPAAPCPAGGACTPRDSAVGAGIKSLLGSAPSGARDCLRSQLGTIASRNSCIGPWTATMNMSLVALKPLPKTRANVTLNLANPLGGLDQLLHGSANLRGWGAPAVPDQTLLQPIGFDATNGRFVYQVNPRFGSTNPAASTIRAPFRITLDVRMDIGPSPSDQLMDQNLRMHPAAVGTRAPADSIKRRYLNPNSSNGFQDIYASLLRHGDTLALSRDQTEKIQVRQVWLRAQADTIFGGLASYLAALPDNFDHTEARNHVTAAQDSIWSVIYGEGPFLRGLLTPGQMLRLPSFVRDMIMGIHTRFAGY